MYVVAHETRKPRRLANLLIEEDNQTDISITQVMQEEADQVIPLLPTWHNLSDNISRIFNRGHMPNNLLSHSRRLVYYMISNRVLLLLQDRPRPLGVVNNRHAVSINICGANQGHSHHSQLVAEATTCFNPIIHCNTLSSKDI
jgi:hypothetical protein